MAKKPSATEVFLELQKEIQTKRFAAIYVLFGDETYFIDRVSQLLEQSVVEESSKSFNQHIVYGKDVTSNDIISISRRYPMMSDFQLVLVKEAQDVKDFENLASYFEKPLPSTILVLALKKGKMDMRSKVAKAASKYRVAEFAPLRDYQIKEWLPKYAEQKGRRIDLDAVNRLIDLMGADLSKIHNELDKIFASVSEEFIRIRHIDEQVGFNREYNIFELQSALGTRNFNKAVQIAHQMGKTAEKGELMGSLVILHKYFNNILLLHGIGSHDKMELSRVLGVNPFFVDEYLRAKSLFSLGDLQKVMNQLKYLDLRLKGINRGAATDADLLVETVVNILSK
jgi:DNA polymerase III subunit delta